MLADTQKELTKVADFLGFAASPQQIATAVERSSVSRMKKLEQAETDDCSLTQGSRKDLSFVRSASAGGWQKDLPPAQAERIETAWGPLMRHLGYELTTSSRSETTEVAIR
jgi:hypothetical protein